MSYDRHKCGVPAASGSAWWPDTPYRDRSFRPVRLGLCLAVGADDGGKQSTLCVGVRRV